ncbi:MAG: T9SS type A sorting domain-containing protein [Lentimicrobium sp.]|nr:T9SS type A sorting domain-containing protein [Lentimicrobium sp.]
MNAKKLTSLILLLIMTMASAAQVTFTAISIPSSTPAEDNLYIAGDFTGWNPGLPEYVMQKNDDGNWFITLPERPEGTLIKFKFTRGSWATVEKGANGEEISDRTFSFGNGQHVEVTIHKWADGGSGGGSTAAANVQVMAESFFMPQLNRNRKIWIYLPPGYETSQNRYPVLYMHDGQNLFDSQTAFAGEWEVDETLNDLAADGEPVPIVIGIENGGTYRIGEYTPWPNPQYGGGDGEAYMQFIVETLKPYVDQNYRTLADRNNTGIMGSSLGGLISHFGGMKYQEIFSKSGIFSPSYWFSDQVWNFTHENPKRENMRFYQLCGTLEGEGVTTNLLRMSDSLLSIGFLYDEIENKVVQGGQHNEAFWRNNFREAFLWLFGHSSASVAEKSQPIPVKIYPNPAGRFFRIEDQTLSMNDTIFITDMSGQKVIQLSGITNPVIDITKLQPGIYLITLVTKDNIYQGKLLKNE